MLPKLFWSITALDGVLFLVLLVMALQPTGQNDGGREMAVAFYVVLPVLVIALAMLLYVLGRGPVWRGMALLVVAGPGLFLAGAQVRSAYIGHAVAQRMLGGGYFSGKAMQAMGEAVVRFDVATLQRIGPSVDVNRVGESGMLLIALAVERAADRLRLQPPTVQKVPDATNDALTTVQVLLALGAKPNPALAAATGMPDPAFLRLLLQAGGDPNLRVGANQPLVFDRLSVLPLANLRLLTQHGLDINAMAYGEPLVLTATMQRRWDLAAFLIEQGADAQRPRDDGRDVAGEVAAQIASETSEGHAMAPALQRLQALTATQASARQPGKAT